MTDTRSSIRTAVLILATLIALHQLPETAAAQPTMPPRASASSADEEKPSSPDAEDDASERRYGHLTLLADAIALTLVIAPVAAGGEPAVSLVGLVVYTLATPSIHAAYRNPWWGPSLGLRLGANLLLFGGVVVALSNCPILSDRCNEGGAAAGTVLAVSGLLLGVAMPIVDAVLAVRPAGRDRTAFVPLYDPRRRAAGLALVGRL